MSALRLALPFLLLALFASPALAQDKASPADIRKLRSHSMEAKNQVQRMQYYILEWKGLGSQVGDSRVATFNQTAEKFATAYKAGAELASTMPGSDPQVAALVDELNASLAGYNKAIADATALLEGAKKAVEDVGGMAAIREDIERIDAIANQFGAFEAILQQRPADAAALLGEHAPALKEIEAFESKYAEFFKQNNADTAQIRRELQSARGTLDGVTQLKTQYREWVIDRASRQMEEAAMIIERGVAERRPAFFGENGGVTQQLRMSDDLVKLAVAIDAGSAMPLVEQLGALKAKGKQAGDALKAEIIAANLLPSDAYRGSDADALKAEAKRLWLERNPGDEVVHVAIPTPQWKRETKWTWFNDAFYFTDRSDLQAAVVFKAKSETGEPELHWYPVDITKDHQNGDALKFSPWVKEPLDQLTVHRRLLPDKLKH